SRSGTPRPDAPRSPPPTARRCCSGRCTSCCTAASSRPSAAAWASRRWCSGLQRDSPLHLPGRRGDAALPRVPLGLRLQREPAVRSELLRLLIQCDPSLQIVDRPVQLALVYEGVPDVVVSQRVLRVVEDGL